MNAIHSRRQYCNGSKSKKVQKSNDHHIRDSYYLCDHDGCGKKFTDYKAYYKHRRLHNRVHKCSFDKICSKAFGKKTDLLIHERIHRNLKSEICQYCDKRFVHPSNLQKHIKYLHQKEIMSKPFVCKKCCKPFERKESLQKHFQSHLNEQERQLYYCKVKGCKVSFTSKSNWNRHVRVYHS